MNQAVICLDSMILHCSGISQLLSTYIRKGMMMMFQQCGECRYCYLECTEWQLASPAYCNDSPQASLSSNTLCQAVNAAMEMT